VNILEAARRGIKSVASGQATSSLYGYPILGRSGRDWHREAGVRYDNSIVYAGVMFAIDALGEVPVVHERPLGDGSWEPVPDSPIVSLLENPNPWYGYSSLLSGWVISELTGVGGQSYTYKHRSTGGRLIGLEYVPHFTVKPMPGAPGSGVFIDHFRLSMRSAVQKVRTHDMLVQRYGPINPLRVQYAVGPLEACLLEVVTDKQAANFTASMLINTGVTPHMISPDGKDADGVPMQFSRVQSAEIEAVWQEKISGDNRGRPLISPLPIKVDSLSLSPSDMNLEAIRNINEERVCAAMRIPPQVLHLGTGLENQNNRASAEEAAKSAARSFTKPYMLKKGLELTRDLVPELGQPGERVRFLWEQIDALQEGQADAAKRKTLACGGPYMTVNEVREEEGLDKIDGGDDIRTTVSLQDNEDNGRNQENNREHRDRQGR